MTMSEREKNVKKVVDREMEQEQINQEQKRTLELNMKLIENKQLIKNLSIQQQVKKKLEKQNKREPSIKEIQEGVFNIKKQDCTSQFKATSRDRREFILRNKTDAPNCLRYNPTMRAVEPNSRAANLTNKFYSVKAKQKKIKQEFESSKICSNVIRNMIYNTGALLTAANTSEQNQSMDLVKVQDTMN